jgi:hypothetical protein
MVSIAQTARLYWRPTVVPVNSDLADIVRVEHFRQFRPTAVLSALLAATLSLFRTRAALQLEIVALRHQLGVLQRSGKKPKLNRFDRMLWSWFCGTWTAWRSTLYIVKPDTVIAWHRQGFRLFWTWKIRLDNRDALQCRRKSEN